MFLPKKKQLQLSDFVNFSKRILANQPDRKKLSVCSIGTGEKSENLFVRLDAATAEQALDDETDDETLVNNNDEVTYSLVYLKPKQDLKDGAKLITDVSRFVSERECF